MVTKDYNLKPVKPVLMAEGAYESGSEYGFDVSPLWIRRQAYYSFLAGAHHTYGHNDSWRVLPTWKQALDAPGAVQLGILKKVFLERKEWWNLVPDQSHLRQRRQHQRHGAQPGRAPHRTATGSWPIWAARPLSRSTWASYQREKRSGQCGLSPRVAKPYRLARYTSSGVQSFSTPDGWEDALLILEVDTTSAAPSGEAKNTDLKRFLPNHGNSVYNAKGLLRQWPPGGPEGAVASGGRVGKERGRRGRRPGVHRRGNRRQAVGPLPRSGHRRHALEAPAAAEEEPPFRVGAGDFAGHRRRSRLLHPLCQLRGRRVGDALPDRLPEDRRHRTVARRQDVLGHRGLDPAGGRRHALRRRRQSAASRARGPRQDDRRLALVHGRQVGQGPRARPPRRR